MEFIHSFVTPIGCVSVTEEDGKITGLFLPNQNLPCMPERRTKILAKAENQINEYLAGRRRRFTLDISVDGTEFFTAVIDSLLTIPYGESRTYSEIATSVGHPGAYRAVGNACASNPVPIIIPCHRAVSSDGIGGYVGGRMLKQRLVNIERTYL